MREQINLKMANQKMTVPKKGSKDIRNYQLPLEITEQVED